MKFRDKIMKIIGQFMMNLIVLLLIHIAIICSMVLQLFNTSVGITQVIKESINNSKVTDVL